MALSIPRTANFLAARLLPIANRRAPDFIVGTPLNPYLLRWYLTPWRHWQRRMGERTRLNPTRWNRLAERMARLLPNVYLHKFLRDDDDRALHDHPSMAASLILRGGYVEHTIKPGGIHDRTTHEAGSARFMPTRHAHRIELLRNCAGDPLHCWTLFWFGPTVREWGFHCPERGWVHWRAFTAADAPGQVGPGCDA